MPCLSYTVRTDAKGSDQLMSSACRTSTTWRSHQGLGLEWGYGQGQGQGQGYGQE